MIGVRNSGALVVGASPSTCEDIMQAKMVKAKIIRGVLVRGTGYPPDAIVDVTPLELAELRATNYAVAATPAEVAAAEQPKAAKVRA